MAGASIGEGGSQDHINGSQGEAPMILQEWPEGDLGAILAEQRPCHYAIANGHHILWVPKHVPCSFEPSSGRLVVQVGHNCRWLAPLHNPRSPLLSVPVGPSVKITPSRRWVPELRFPRNEPWRRAQVLELDFSKVDKSECCPLARVRIYSEELRSLREALQLMVQRGAHKGIDPKRKGDDPDGSGGVRVPSMAPIAESSTPEPPNIPPQPASPQHSSPVHPATPVRLGESPPTGCACFPGLRRRHIGSQSESFQVAPRAAPTSGGAAESIGPDTPQQKSRETAVQPQQPQTGTGADPYADPGQHFASGSDKRESSGRAQGAAAASDAGIEALNVPEPALRRGPGSGTLSSVDEASSSFTAAAGAGDSAAEAARERRAGSGDSVSSMANPRKGYQPGGAKTLAWGDSAQESPLSTTAGPSTATSSQRGSGDSGSHRVFFGLEAAGPTYPAQKGLSRPEFGSGSTTAASSRRPSGEVSGESIWSSRGSSRGSNEALVDRASNFKRSLEAAQHAFYRDISPETTSAAAGFKIVAPARAVAAATPGPADRPAAPPRSVLDTPLPSGAAAAGAAAGAAAPSDLPSATARAAPGTAGAAASPAARSAAAAAELAGPAERRRRAEGRSLPELLMQTAQAVRSCPEFSEPLRGPRDAAAWQAAPRSEKAKFMSGGSGGLKVTHSDNSLTRYTSGDAAGPEIWDTARGPAGQYWDVPRAARSLEAGTRFVLQPGRGNASDRLPIGLRAPQEPIAPTVRQQVSLIVQSKRSCGEVWAPGYESSPEVSSDEGENPPAAQRLAPSHQRTKEGTVRETTTQTAAQPSWGAAAVPGARPAVAESPFRPRPPKTSAGNAPAAAQPAPGQATTSRLRPKRLFQSPPGDDHPPPPNLATQPDPATPRPATPRTAQRDASSGGAISRMPASLGHSTAATEYISLPAIPLPATLLPDACGTKDTAEPPSSTAPNRKDDSGALSTSPFQRASFLLDTAEAADAEGSASTANGAAREAAGNGAVASAAPSSVATPQKAAASGNESSPGVWLSSGLYASSSQDGGSSDPSSAFQTPGKGDNVAAEAGNPRAEPLVAVKLKVSKSRPAGFVAAAIAALGLSSPVVQRPSSQGEAVSLSVTPIPQPGAAIQRLALSPDLVDMSWFTGRLTSAKPTAMSAATSAASAAALGVDRVAAAAARLLAAAPAASVAPEAAAADPSSPPAPGKSRAAPDSLASEPEQESSALEASAEGAADEQPATEEGGKDAEAMPRDGGGPSKPRAAPSNTEHNGTAAVLPGDTSEGAAGPLHAPPVQKRVLPDGGSETEGSPRPPGLLYKPELRSVAERVKYIERRSHSRNLDLNSPRAPRGVPSPRGAAPEAAGSQPVPASSSVQRQTSSALTTALRDTALAAPHLPKDTAGGPNTVSTAGKRYPANHSKTATDPATAETLPVLVQQSVAVAPAQRAPSFNNWTEKDDS